MTKKEQTVFEATGLTEMYKAGFIDGYNAVKSNTPWKKIWKKCSKAFNKRFFKP